MQATELAPPLPRRAVSGSDVVPDDSEGIFALLAQGLAEGQRAALLTLVETTGGSSRPVGAQMAVLADGRFAGYLSSGCVETAIASEAIALINRDKSAVLRFGVGSPFLDIRLPCGGSMDVLVDVRVTAEVVGDARRRLAARKPFSISFGAGVAAALVAGAGRTGWSDDVFRRTYLPALKLMLFGRGLEFEALARLARAAGYPLEAFAADEGSVERLAADGLYCGRLDTPAGPPEFALDERTAVVLLFHDHEWETEILDRVLRHDCLYVGALGSARTHRLRCERLLDRGHGLAQIDRIRGPIGLFGPTRDASSLAISVLAELASLRAMAEA